MERKGGRINERQYRILGILEDKPDSTTYGISKLMKLDTNQIENSLKGLTKYGLVKMNNGDGKKRYSISPAASSGMITTYAENVANLIYEMAEIDPDLENESYVQILEIVLDTIEISD